MSRPVSCSGPLPFLSLVLGLAVSTAGLFPAASHPPSETPSATASQAEIVIGGRVATLPDGLGRRVGPQTGLAGATAELLAFRDLYRVLEQVLSGAEPSKPVASDRTDERGFYELSAPAYGRWTLRLSAPGMATHQQAMVAYLPWEEHRTVPLAERREVAIRVLDPEGRPVAGARVVGWPQPDDPHSVETAFTGDDGTVTLPDAQGTPIRLAAFVPGHAPAETIDAEGGTAVLQLRTGLLRRVEVRQGRGAPVPDALVLLGESGIPAGKTDDDGRLEIWTPAKEPLSVRALAPDLRSASVRVEPPEPERSETTEGAQEPSPIRLDLDPLPMVSGRVVDAKDRTPLAEVLLWAPDAGEGLTVSDRAGGFRLALPEVPDHAFRVLAILPGYVPRGFPVEPDSANGPIPTVALSPAAAVLGTVVDVAGEPVAGAEIEILGRFRDRGLARSGARGRFLVPSLTPTSAARLRAEKPGYAPTTLDIPLLEGGRTVAGLRVVLERGRSVIGRVVDGEDRPVSGAEVWLIPRGTDPLSMSRFARYRTAMEGADALSRSDGGFRVDHLAEGPYDLRVDASGFAPAEVPGIEIPEGGGAAPAEGPLDLGTVVLDSAVQLIGRVVDPEGVPLAGVRLRTVSRSERWGPPRTGLSDSVTDAEGRFALRDFRSGESVSIFTEHPGYADSRLSNVEVPAPEPLEIVLQPAARIRGIVLDPQGRPVENAQIRADRTAQSWGFGRPSTNRTDSEGRFTVSDVEPGEITVMAWAEGYLRDAMVHLDVAPGGRIDGVEITLHPGATVSGQVTGPDGEPLIQARVHLVRQDSPRSPGDGMELTDGDGRYRLDGIATGPQTFGAHHGDHPPTVRDLEVRPGENRLDFRLETGSRVSGRVLDSGGSPVAGVAVRLQPLSHAESRQEISRSDGSFALLGVPDGAYRMYGSHRELGETSLEEPLTLRGDDLSGIELRYEGGSTIRGRILGLNLDELAAIRVRSFSDTGRGQWTRPDYEGNFVLEGVAPGTWTLMANSSGRQVNETVEVPEGVSEVEVELEFRSGLTLAGRVLLGSEPMREGSVAANRSDGSGSGSGSSGFDALDHEGRFRIEGLEEGTYQMRILGPSGVQHQQEVEVPTDGEVLITLEPALLHGRVVDAVTGDPLSGVEVSLFPRGEDPRGGRGIGVLFGSLRTDSRGVFRVPDVAAGPYRLVLTKDGYSRTETSIAVDPGPSEPLEIRLQPSQGQILQLSWAPGLIPSAWVHVTATGPDGQIGLTERYPVSASGLVRLTSLPPGIWTIRVHATGGSAEVQVSSPGPTVPVSVVPESPSEDRSGEGSPE